MRTEGLVGLFEARAVAGANDAGVVFSVVVTVDKTAVNSGRFSDCFPLPSLPSSFSFVTTAIACRESLCARRCVGGRWGEGEEGTVAAVVGKIASISSCLLYRSTSRGFL